MERLCAALLSMLFLTAIGCADEEPMESVAATLSEPASARFQSIRERGDYVCGEVNGRTGSSVYSGYRRFVYDERGRRAMVDPRLAPGGKTSRASGSGCDKPFAYQSVEERLTCAEAPAQQPRADRQREFDALWSSACDPD
jgi:hypothetical protein